MVTEELRISSVAQVSELLFQIQKAGNGCVRNVWVHNINICLVSSIHKCSVNSHLSFGYQVEYYIYICMLLLFVVCITVTPKSPRVEGHIWLSMQTLNLSTKLLCILQNYCKCPLQSVKRSRHLTEGDSHLRGVQLPSQSNFLY